MENRRSFLMKAMGVACSAAASPLITPVTFASAPSDNRLVVIILRGAMDGLDVVRPIGDRNLKMHRPDFVNDGLPITDFYAMHPTLGGLSGLWDAGELAFAHAVSTPYRDKRSHFDGQDLLEAGFGDLESYYEQPVISGWMNRMLTQMEGVHAETAFAVGTEDLILLKGAAPSSSWAPGRTLTLSEQGQNFLQRIYEHDPLFHTRAETAIELSKEVIADMEMDEQQDMQSMMMENLSAARQSRRARALAEFTADQLLQSTRIAAFSIGGWDTHRAQMQQINGPLTQLAEAISTLKQSMGAHWEKTTVIGVTEFGRTVRINGSGGSDHGTGGAMIMAGGAIKGGRVYGKWPGLRSRDLYENRDLMPTADLREYMALAIRDLFGINATTLERVVFPSLSMSGIPSFIA
ncbi:MAG: DUF1501 domain-containing protein [Pseudomonadota bacterium]